MGPPCHGPRSGMGMQEGEHRLCPVPGALAAHPALRHPLLPAAKSRAPLASSWVSKGSISLPRKPFLSSVISPGCSNAVVLLGGCTSFNPPKQRGWGIQTRTPPLTAPKGHTPLPFTQAPCKGTPKHPTLGAHTDPRLGYRCFAPYSPHICPSPSSSTILITISPLVLGNGPIPPPTIRITTVRPKMLHWQPQPDTGQPASFPRDIEQCQAWNPAGISSSWISSRVIPCQRQH